MKLHLIRHGNTEGTERHLYYGTTDLPLSPAGREQLRHQAEAGGYPPLEGCQLYSTGMRRTEETLEIIYGQQPHGTIPQMKEINFGVFEMESHQSLLERADYQSWISGKFLANTPPQGESYLQFCSRVIPALEGLVAARQDAILVCHGGTISAVMSHLFPREGKTTYDWIPNPGEGYSVTIGGENSTYLAIPTPRWLEAEYAFFQHKGCECFPCHQIENPKDFNCLFCYCPLYALGENCGGNFSYTEKGIKNCAACTVPHRRENYGRILSQMRRLQKLAQQTLPDSESGQTEG